MSRWLVRAAVLGAALLLVIVVLVGLHPEYQLRSALQHMLQSGIDPVESNPVLPEVTRARVSWVGDIPDLRLHESSALAASNLHEDVLWSLNDSGNGATLYAIGLDGRTRGVMHIDTPYHYDWEALDAFTNADGAFLIIGDTGDNFRWRTRRTLIVVREPDHLSDSDMHLDEAEDDPPIEPASLPVAWYIHYSYPGGPRDVEAMAVDSTRQRILLLSKRVYPPELFSLPLVPADNTVARKVTDLAGLPRPLKKEVELDSQAVYRHMPSGMDVSNGPGPVQLFLTTYKHGYLFDLEPEKGMPINLRKVPLPTLGQREALTFARDSERTAYVSKERRGGVGVADLCRIELLDVSARTPAADVVDAP